MEDIRPYSSNEDERDEQAENPVEWELARYDVEEEVPFHLPRD